MMCVKYESKERILKALKKRLGRLCIHVNVTANFGKIERLATFLRRNFEESPKRCTVSHELLLKNFFALEAVKINFNLFASI